MTPFPHAPRPMLRSACHWFLTVFLLIVAPCISLAAPLKTYVSEFSVIGVANKDELKVTLQGLLASRLNPNQVQLVEQPDRAELVLTGSYAQFGKMFSIDVLLKNNLIGNLSKVFEQGESQDDLLPAFGRLAQKLDKELGKVPATPTVAVQPKPVASPSAVPAPAIPVAAAVVAAPPLAYKVETPVVKTDESYVVKSGIPAQNAPGVWGSEPFNGILSSLALGRTLPGGDREIFAAGDRTIRYLRKGAELKQVAEISLPASAKILAIDSADLDHDGVPELYVSIVDRKTISSSVYQPTESGLELVADNQPWLFRAMGADLKERTVFAQGVSSSGEYRDGVGELKKSGRTFDVVNMRSLPRHGNIFNFARFKDAAGKEKWAVLDEDGYLLIYGADGDELWKSSDKFGGSENYFNYDSVAQLRSKAISYRWNFLEQRITVLADGTLVVPRNDGLMSVGNNRSFSKHSLFGLSWSGSMYREAWHTRQSPSYLADYAIDTATREVVLLEVVQKAGLFGTGKTTISINKLD